MYMWDMHRASYKNKDIDWHKTDLYQDIFLTRYLFVFRKNMEFISLLQGPLIIRYTYR